MKRYLRYIACMWFVCALPIMVKAQRDTQHATTFGIGKTSHLDTYLSPLEYQGPELLVMSEKLRCLKHNSHITYQTSTLGRISSADSPTGHGGEFGGDIQYASAWMYTWRDCGLQGLHIHAGGQIQGSIGFLYNTRNGNNPAQAYLSADLTIKALATYDLHIRKQTLTLRYQPSVPLIGAMFSPNYGQSYYEIFSLGDYDHNVCFKYPGNGFCLDQQLSVDLPIRHATLRLGYLNTIRQATPNQLKQHHISHAFMIGYVRNLTIKRP